MRTPIVLAGNDSLKRHLFRLVGCALLVLSGSWNILTSLPFESTRARSSNPPVVLHDCLLVFRYGNDPRFGVALQGSEARDVNGVGEVVGWAASATGAIHAMRWNREGARDLGTLGGQNSCALGINEVGQIVGWAETTTGARHAVRWDNGVAHDLGAFPGEMSFAYAINEAGQAVGLSWPTSALAIPMGRAVVWDGDEMTDIGADLDSWGSGALDINERGDVVGWFVPNEGGTRAFLWSPNGVESLPVAEGVRISADGINDTGHVVGWAEFPNQEGERHAILWTDGRPTDLNQSHGESLGVAWAVANDVNALGDVAGAVQDPDGSLHAVVWLTTDGATLNLGTLGGSKAEAYAINDDGLVVGWSLTATGEPTAFLWSDGSMMELRADLTHVRD